MTTDLRIETFTMPAAPLGPENPLPPLGGCLPYRLLDGYSRERSPRDFKVAVLENGILRAMFLLELGGRLWSLIHKPSGRELLDRNPVFQPAALGVRNAWFSGGVEWNFCAGGHTPLTCSPVFAARLHDDDGSPILRIYEFERALRAPYQMDFSLPEDSPWLFVRVRLSNPSREATRMYWWSNIAVPESPDLRVLAPADSAFQFAYAGSMKKLPMPRDDGLRDASYPVNLPGAADYFFDIPDGHRPWEAALDGTGRGLVHASTSRLRGRKMFVWGMSPGGRHWQEWLSEKGHPYIEIQAGVARTQWEQFAVEGGEEVSWVEAYGLMEADPVRTHGTDWAAAWQDVERRLDHALPLDLLEQRLDRAAASAAREPEEVLHRGSGWGALESERRRAAGELPLHSSSIRFDAASLGPDQQPWLTLLRTGVFPEQDEPGAWMVQKEWFTLLERSRSRHWLACLHLGVMQYHAGDKERAQRFWEDSLGQRTTPWALRNLARLSHDAKRPAEAAGLYLQAYRMCPALTPLAIECGRALIEAGRSTDFLGLLDGMPPSVRRYGRIRLLEARAALEVGDLDRAEGILTEDHLSVPDLYEGELLLSETWYRLKEQRLARAAGAPVDEALQARVRRDFPPPANLDFRMAAVVK